jgi:hypothetical protein
MAFEICRIDSPSAQSLFQVFATMESLTAGRDFHSLKQEVKAERRELGNNLGERKVESAWPGKATGRDTVNATISMRTDFLVGRAGRSVEVEEPAMK